ncbi:right-handed parallel beta-helix repeat-containing protein [Pirellulimonas nuda]|uniref:hypothetical protein n=1 Tax=Pirellulimonas nuda TaxID=2528009 RepID=UPI00119FC1F0|nr:hypothetical protein [Pirellulimonas nuda]
MSASAAATLLLPEWLLAAQSLSNNPTSRLGLAWTEQIRWGSVLDVTRMEGGGKYWDKRLVEAQSRVAQAGGGVIYFPAGDYHFENHIHLKDGVVLRGATPRETTNAHDEAYRPETRLEFPQYRPSFTGEGNPIDSAFKGIYLETPATAANCGVVNIDINRGHIHFEEAEDHRCGGNRLVFGCVLRNCAVADPRIPSGRVTQHAWQRFTSRHHAAIDVKGSENLLVANNRLPENGDDNFTMKDFLLKPNRGGADRFDVVFDYDNRPGLYVGHYCVGGAGGSGDDGTPESHPYGFRRGIVIRDNYVFNTGRVCIGFAGDGTLCANNVTRIKKDVWRPTATGEDATSGSSTNDNRAIEMRGWGWIVDGNDCRVHRNWCADHTYYINDGEGLMHEDHCNSDVRESRLTNNKVNSYLSIYKCGAIDGLLIQGNGVSTPGDIADIYVVSDRNSGAQPCEGVIVADNTTQSNGILIQGSPANGNVVKDNRHLGKEGVIRNKANAKLSGNIGYQT